jgi:3-carboxy-cis,cis-muconate cycloisomerase
MPDNEMLFREGNPETWGRLELKDLFGDDHSMQLIMNIEAAMARVQAKFGIIPQAAADEICRKAQTKCRNTP